MVFVYLFLYFVVVDNASTLFNWFLRDFRGFCDFLVFGLADTKRFILTKDISSYSVLKLPFIDPSRVSS